MPRYPTQTSLPPLAQLFSRFGSLEKTRSKLNQITDTLRPMILTHRTHQNQKFYSTRQIATFFKVSQNTAALVIKELEKEGLLRRVRSSQTQMLGSRVITPSRIRAVAGLLLWHFADRFSPWHTGLARSLSAVLWPEQIAFDIIPHYDLGEKRPDLDELLKRHTLNFAIWPFPFRHHRDHLLRLQDRGIRNLVIGLEPEVDGNTSPGPPDLIVEIIPAYRRMLSYWKEEQGIRRVLVVRPREFEPRGRIEFFARLAAEMGFDTQIVPSTHALPAKLVAREKKPIGIALLDEHSTAEFVFYDPPAFVKLLKRHRILFGNECPNIPFVPHGEQRVERIFIPNASTPSRETKIPFAVAVKQTLMQWSSGDFSTPPPPVTALAWTNGKLWRYL